MVLLCNGFRFFDVIRRDAQGMESDRTEAEAPAGQNHRHVPHPLPRAPRLVATP